MQVIAFATDLISEYLRILTNSTLFSIQKSVVKKIFEGGLSGLAVLFAIKLGLNVFPSDLIVVRYFILPGLT